MCSLACIGCQHFSPQRPRETIPAAAYRPGLEALSGFAAWETTFVGGGEPFLHPDLAGFLDGVTGFAPAHLITNGFWLLRDAWWEIARPVLARVACLIVSRYPVYINKLGVTEWDRRLDVLRQDSGVPITSFHDGDPDALTFAQHGYHDAPKPVARPPRCMMRHCFQLMPEENRLAKCPLGRGLDVIPNATEAFRASYRAHSYYDLSRAGEGFAEWAAPDDHPACGLCGIGTGEMWTTKWASDARARTAKGREYEALIRRGAIGVAQAYPG